MNGENVVKHLRVRRTAQCFVADEYVSINEVGWMHTYRVVSVNRL